MTHRVFALVQQARSAPVVAQTPSASEARAAAQAAEQSAGMLMGLLGQRRSLNNEVEELQGKRAALTSDIQNAKDAGTRKALEQSRGEVERRLNEAEIGLRAINRAIAG